MSLATCSMLCGSTQLWPQPTGPVTLGTRAINFHHQQLRYENSMTGPVKVSLWNILIVSMRLQFIYSLKSLNPIKL